MTPLDNGMLDRLRQLAEKLEELNARMERPDFYADPKKAAAFLREQKELTPVVAAYRGYLRAQRDMSEAAELMNGQTDAELRALCQEEYSDAKKARRGARAGAEAPAAAP